MCNFSLLVWVTSPASDHRVRMLANAFEPDGCIFGMEDYEDTFVVKVILQNNNME